MVEKSEKQLLAEHGVALDNLRGRVTVLEGRIGSYADAELAYRNAEAALKRLHGEHADEHSKMLTSAKNILDGAVGRAIEPFEEPLRTVAEIRKAQEERHTREQVLAEQALESKQRRDHRIRFVVTWTGVVAALAEVLRALHL